MKEPKQVGKWGRKEWVLYAVMLNAAFGGVLWLVTQTYPYQNPKTDRTSKFLDLAVPMLFVGNLSILLKSRYSENLERNSTE